MNPSTTLPYDGRIPHTCTYCQNELISLQTAPYYPGDSSNQTVYRLQTNGEGAIEAAKNGCLFWEWFIKDFIDDDDGAGDRNDRSLVPSECWFELNFTRYGKEKDGRGRVYPFPFETVGCSRRTLNMWSEHGTLNILADEGDPAWESVCPRPREVPVATEDNFALSRRWIEECHESHSGCSKPSRTFTPTRLLMITDDRVCLYLPEASESLKWAALSYCWGGYQTLQTIAETLASRIKGITVSELPQTIQDALLTTQKLGLNYLWVDSLCIIQDSPSDMTHEISLIPQIYSNAVITISAARSTSSAEGFLHPITHPTPQDESFRLRFLTPKGEIGTIILYGQSDLLHRRDPIESRAWTLQEHLLSPRLLIFGSRQIWWTCRKVHTNMFEHGSFSTYSEIGEIRLRFLDIKVSQRRRRLKNIPGQTWLSLCQHYTDRVLSFGTDKLPAISGIAEYYARRMDDEYLAGHFRKSLLSSLLWKRAGAIAPKPERYRAPSWSWASVDGPVRWEHKRAPLSTSLEFVDCKVSLVSDSSLFGAVKGGKLTIRGRLRKILWNSERTQLFAPDTKAPFLAETIPDFVSKEPVGETTIFALELLDYAPRPENDSYCLPGQEEYIFGQSRAFRWPAVPKGLLLELREGGVYVRVGLFAFREWEDLTPEGKQEKEEVEREKENFFDGVAVGEVCIV